jgi:hypothetical protein
MTEYVAQKLADHLKGREFSHEGDWGIIAPAPGGKVAHVDSFGVYLFASEGAVRDFHAGADYEVSPVLDAAEFCDLPANLPDFLRILGDGPATIVLGYKGEGRLDD